MKLDNYVPNDSWLTFIKQTIKPKRGRLGNNEGQNIAMAIYKCKCGKEVEKMIARVKNGNVKSCGCMMKHIVHVNAQNKTHGLSSHPLYNVWRGIKNRCYNKNTNRYYCYGALGVIMCDEWLKNPASFITWALDNGWRKGLQIDKDIVPKKLGIPAKIYSPEMCSIVTNKENSYGKGVKMYEFNGKVKSLFDWSIELNISRRTLLYRLKTMGIDVAFKLL